MLYGNKATGSPGGSEGESVCLQCGRPGFNPWVGKIPVRRKWQPTPVLLPGESHGQRSLVGYSQSMGLQRIGHDWAAVVMYGYESWTVKRAESQKIDAFELWCWRRLLRVPWTARRSSQSILKEISPGYSLEGLMLKLKLQYFGHLMQWVDSLEKTLMLGGIWGQEEKGMTEDEMAGWHHQLGGHEFE